MSVRSLGIPGTPKLTNCSIISWAANEWNCVQAPFEGHSCVIVNMMKLSCNKTHRQNCIAGCLVPKVAKGNERYKAFFLQLF